jgi:ribosome-associated heat shock protein Hsp15
MPARQRLDKWIWIARFVRTRVAAAELVRSGHVRVAGRRIVEPGHFVRPGDVLTLALPGRTIVIRIVDFAQRRGGAAEAAGLYALLETTDAAG